MRPITALLILLMIALTGVLWLEVEHGLFEPERAEPAKNVAAAATTAQQPAAAQDEEGRQLGGIQPPSLLPGVAAPASGGGHGLGQGLGPFTDMVERPLFSPSRRPPKIEAPVETAEAKQPVKKGPDPVDLLRYSLVGTVIAGQQRIALLRDPGVTDLIELRRGDQLHGWRVSEVTTATIVFERQGRTVELQIAPPKSN